MRSLKMLDLFSGIGGFTLAAQMVGGIETKQFCEIDPHCQKVLMKNFPGIPIHDDITTFTPARGTYDLITGGFPCQDVSNANSNGRGLEGERSGLFYELMRIVRECRPRYVVLENVSALLSGRKGRDMAAVLWELSESGFDAEWQTISAASVGAPHLRERVFIVAYRDSQRCGRSGGDWQARQVYRDQERHSQASSAQRCELLTEPSKNGQAASYPGCQRHKESRDCGVPQEERQNNAHANFSRWQQVEPPVLRVDDGISNRVDRIMGLGNAVVPQVAAISLQRVLEINKSMEAA